MNGVQNPALIEVLVRERPAVVAGLLGAIALSWLYLVPATRDMYGGMSGISAWMMRTDWDAAYIALIFGMWAVMMVGMMLPSAAPAILLFTRVLQNSAGAEKPVARSYAFAGGYLLAWLVFSAAATLLQWALARTLLLSPMMESASPALTASVLIAAGLYQWTLLKQACLTRCRAPVEFLTGNFRPGAGGALTMGAHHGLYCVGCCWALMLLLFAGGVMNLLWIGAITVAILLEKLAPQGAHAGRVGGALLVLAGLWVIARA